MTQQIEIIKGILDSQKEKTNKYSVFLKTIISFSVGLLGILISFKADIPVTYMQKLFFFLTILSLAIGILFSIILLYSEIHSLNKQIDVYFQSLKKSIHMDSFSPKVIVEDFPKGFQISRIIAFSSYIFSLACICCYSYFIMFK